MRSLRNNKRKQPNSATNVPVKKSRTEIPVANVNKNTELGKETKTKGQKGRKTGPSNGETDKKEKANNKASAKGKIKSGKEITQAVQPGSSSMAENSNDCNDQDASDNSTHAEFNEDGNAIDYHVTPGDESYCQSELSDGEYESDREDGIQFSGNSGSVSDDEAWNPEPDYDSEYIPSKKRQTVVRKIDNKNKSPGAKTHEERIKEIDNEMTVKIKQLHKLMTQGGAHESAHLL